MHQMPVRSREQRRREELGELQSTQVTCKRKEFAMSVKYRVYRFDVRMTSDQSKLEQFLNGLEGEIIAIIPNVTMGFFWIHRVDFLLIVEKVN
jgi:hypothetical protein